MPFSLATNKFYEVDGWTLTGNASVTDNELKCPTPASGQLSSTPVQTGNDFEITFLTKEDDIVATEGPECTVKLSGDDYGIHFDVYRTGSSNYIRIHHMGSVKTSASGVTRSTSYQQMKIKRTGTTYELTFGGKTISWNYGTARNVENIILEGQGSGTTKYFDSFKMSDLSGNLFSIYRDTKYSPITSGGTDGEAVSEVTETAIMEFDILDNEANAESAPRKFAIRCASGGSASSVVITPRLTGYLNYNLAPDSGGSPGTWQGWGSALSIGSIDDTNTIFWVKTKVTAAEAVGAQLSCVFQASHSGVGIFDADIRRKVVPYLKDLGTSGAHYMGFDFGSDNFEHDTTNGGDIDIIETDGATPATYNDIKYSTYSKVGNIITLTKTLRSGFTLETRYTKISSGVYKVEHDLTSNAARRVRLTRNITGSSTNNTSTVTLFKDGTTKNCEDEVFQAAGLHHPSDEVAVALVAGEPYANEWCLFKASHTGDTGWYNSDVIYKTGSLVALNYGLLASEVTTDYSVHLSAGVKKTLSYAIAVDIPNNQAEFNEVVYSALADAFYNVGTYSARDKLLWSTAKQLIRPKRHDPNHTEAKWLWIVPSKHYSPDMFPSDLTWITYGMNDGFVAEEIIDTVHNLSRDDAQADGLSGPADSMGAAAPYYNSALILYAMNFFGFSPSSAIITEFTSQADKMAARLGKMIPNQAILGHKGIGDFEDPFEFTHVDTFYLWTTETQGAGSSATRVGTDGGNAPHGGSWQGKLVADTGVGDFARLKMMKLACLYHDDWQSSTEYKLTQCVEPTTRSGFYYECTTAGTTGGTEPTWPTTPGNTVNDGTVTWTCRTKEITLTAWLNIPAAFSTNGFRLRVKEYNVSESEVANHAGSFYSTTSGWEQKSYVFTPNANARWLYFCLEAVSDETASRTAYVDNVQATMTNLSHAGICWSLLGFSPDGLRSDAIGVRSNYVAGLVLAMRCNKQIIGANWTGTHETALQNLEATFPAIFWKDSAQTRLRYDLYHPVRRSWQAAGDMVLHWTWYVLSSGEKYMTDTQVSNIYNNWPKTNLGLSYGNVGLYCMVIKHDGNYTETSEWKTGSGTQGRYQNGSLWLVLEAMIYQSAHWAGVSGARENFQKRLAMETYNDYSSHEYLETDPTSGNYRTCPAEQRGYGWNVLMLAEAIPFNLTATNIDSVGCNLSWDQYPNSDGKFSKYSICRSLTPYPIYPDDQIAEKTVLTQTTHHDETAESNTPYWYRIFVVKTDAVTLGSEIVGITTVVIKTVSDSGQGSDALPGIGVSLSVGDAGAGADLIASLSVYLKVLESAYGVDAVIKYTGEDHKNVIVTFTAKGPRVAFKGKGPGVEFSGKGPYITFN